jgi:DNA-binding NarL/FixJ family response regulator
MPRYHVLLIEDDAPTRARLARVIEAHPQLQLSAAVGSCAAARAVLAREAPDVMLVDLGLPDGSGIDLIQDGRRAGKPVEAMVITVFGDERHVLSAIEAGASGYLLKDGDSGYIGESIMQMLAGGSPISAPIARHLLQRFRPPASVTETGGTAVPGLTQREQEVLELVAKGFSYADIAGLLSMSVHTVTTHVKSIYRKLAVSSRGAAVYEAVQLGLIKLQK